MRAALYARFSSDLQKDASIDDQFRLCREYAQREGHAVTQSYSDAGISGASIVLRPDLIQLMSDARLGLFDVLIVEAIDRLSRNQRDIADIYQNMSFAGIPILSVSEGKINELHIGLKGTMNALFLKDLAIKTRRGQRGRVEAGRIPGGLSYGYDMVPGEDRGKRTINAEQADIVRRIFSEYAQGYSPRSIAKRLNAEAVPSPRGGQWQASTINGNIKRGNGILPNRLYIGEIVYNRQTFMKDPRTGKRTARVNPESDWVVKPVPELAIIDRATWEAVQARKSGNKRPEKYRRSRHLISGLIQCEACGGPFIISGPNHLRCSHNRERGTCENNQIIRKDDAESRIMNALQTHLLNPKWIQVFIEEYRSEWESLAGSRATERSKLEKSLGRCDSAIAALIKTLESGIVSQAIADKLKAREAEANAIKAKLRGLPERQELPMPQNLVNRWKDTLGSIRAHIRDDEIIPASDLLKSIVQSVEMIPKHEKTYDLMITGLINTNAGCGGRI